MGPITVKDSAGKSATSLGITVGEKSNDDGGGGGGGDCPIGDPQMCDIICGIKPDLPFCKGGF